MASTRRAKRASSVFVPAVVVSHITKLTTDVRPFNLPLSGLERVASAVCQAPQIGSAMAKGCRCGHWEAEASARHFGHSAQGSRSTPA